MKFYYLDDESYEVGPFDDAAMLQLAREGEIGRETLMRNHMMEDDWRPAEAYDFMLKALPPKEEPPPDHIPEELERYGVFAPFMVEKKRKVSSKFNYKVVPDYAGPGPRFLAALFDFGIWFLATWLLCLFMVLITGKQTIVPEEYAQRQAERQAAAARAAADPETAQAAPAEEAEAAGEEGFFRASVRVENGSIYWHTSPGNIYVIPVSSLTVKFGIVFFITLFSYLIVYASLLGFMGQSPGMWYMGMLAVKPDLGEVLPFRAWAYTLAWVVLGWTFIFVYPFMKMSLPERLTGIRLVRISSKALAN